VTSPYERSLDLTGLDPELRAYFTGIPDGQVGVGRGVFDVVGTPRRWLWPVLALLARDGIVAPVWEHTVPFVVVNRPTRDGSLVAERRFDLPGGRFTMVDRMTARHGSLIDRLGHSRRVAAMFTSRVEDGALHLRSIEVRVRIGRSWLRFPDFVSPRVDLVESFDRTSGLQHVAVELTLPVLGRIYEYAGSFSYAIVPERDNDERRQP